MGPLDPDLVIIFAGILGVVSVVSITRTIRARLDRQGARPGELQAIQARMEQIATAVDAIAVEVERISEGQRFTTKLLAERESARLGDPRTGGSAGPH